MPISSNGRAKQRNCLDPVFESRIGISFTHGQLWHSGPSPLWWSVLAVECLELWSICSHLWSVLSTCYISRKMRTHTHCAQSTQSLVSRWSKSVLKYVSQTRYFEWKSHCLLQNVLHVQSIHRPGYYHHQCRDTVWGTAPLSLSSSLQNFTTSPVL